MEHRIVVCNSGLKKFTRACIKRRGVLRIFLIKDTICLFFVGSVAVNYGYTKFLRGVSLHLPPELGIIEFCCIYRRNRKNRVETADALFPLDLFNGIPAACRRHLCNILKDIVCIGLVPTIRFLIKVSEDIFRHQANALRGQICFFPINVPDLFIINILFHIHCFDIVHTEWQDILIVDGVHNRIGMKLIAESLCRSPQRRLFTDTGIGGKDRRSGETKQVILFEIPGNGKIVQRIRDGRRRVTPMGEMPILSGMVFCADCGKKLYQVRGRNLPQKEYMVCSTYRKIKGGCSSHQIRNEVLERLLLDGIQAVTAYAREHEADFVELITQKSQTELDKSLRDGKREMEQAQARIRKLDDIIQWLYEDNLEGKVSDERFARMTANYEEEQKGLESRVAELKKLLAAEKDRSVNVDHFLTLVRKYTDVQELTAEIVREFVEKVYVHQAERIDGQKVQRIRIVWNCIGEFTPPTVTNTEKSA